jgi:cytochrome P450
METAAATVLTDVPLPRSVPLWRSVLNLTRRDPLPHLLRLMRDEGDLVRIPLGPLVYILAQHPDHVGYVLQENAANYRKSFNYEALRMVVGDGLLVSEGDFWKRQRRLAAPAFHRAALVKLVDKMVQSAHEQVQRWAALPEGAVIDASEELMQLTLRIVGRALFSVELGGSSEADGEATAFGKAVTVCLNFVVDRTRSLVRLPGAIPTPRHLRLKRALKTLDATVFRIIEERRRSQASRDDLLGLLMAARDDETGEAMNDRHLRDEVLTFLAAGHETTANALTWTLYLLSKNPAERRRAEDEVAAVLHGRAPAVEDLPKLEHLRRCVEEAMRLYPPAWFIERQAVADDAMGGKRIPKGAVVGISAFSLHRDPRFFDNPEGFDPDRFLPARSASRPRFAYVPFGGGPRSCIGNQFAMWEAQLILATLLPRLRLDLVPGPEVELDPLVTLRPRGGMAMRVRRR